MLSSPLSPHKTSCGFSSSPLTPHRTSGSLKPSLLTSPYHKNSASLSCALALSFSSPTRADTTPAKKQCQGMYSGSNCEVLNEVAKMMENNAQRLQSIAESEDPITRVRIQSHALPRLILALIQIFFQIRMVHLSHHGCPSCQELHSVCSSSRRIQCSACDSLINLRRNIRHDPIRDNSSSSRI